MKDSIVIIFLLILGVLIIVLSVYSYNPYKKFNITKTSINITNKRSKDREEYIDLILISDRNIIHRAEQNIIDYKQYYITTKNELISSSTVWKKHRLEQLEKRYSEIRFDVRVKVYREITKYKQVNYVKYPYKVESILDEFYITIHKLKEINDELKNSDYTLTRKQFESKNQRKLMTNELKLKVKQRDNYTCQCCGKYMPDEVGLHIDHIIPISKGGKSTLSNLQVLCSKCNLKKSDRVK